MQANTVSRTAAATSLIRAAHTRMESNPLIHDSLGDKIIPDDIVEILYQNLIQAGKISPDINAGTPRDVINQFFLSDPSCQTVITRSRFTRDCLHKAVKNGVKDYVIIGAGLDGSFLDEDKIHRDLNIFEIDHPDTQAFKLQQLKKHAIQPSENVHFISADLSQENFSEVLTRTIPRNQENFYSWLGVTMYLTNEDNMATLKAIGEHSATGSELVFDYFDQATFDKGFSLGYHKADDEIVKNLGEPFLSGFHPDRLATELNSVGLELIEDLSALKLARKYFNSECQEFSDMHVAHVRVV